MNKHKHILRRLICKIKILLTSDLEKKIQVNSVLLAKLLNESNLKIPNYNSLHQVEFKVFSQWGEDGIIQFLINKIKIKNKIFIEFGVQNYKESNTRFLLVNNNWSGLIIDGSKEFIDFIKNDEIYWRYDLTAINAFITRENINSLISEYSQEEEIGILSIDIDGNDYWILKEINTIKPSIIICEYNSIYGNSLSLTVPYNAAFDRTKAHYSNLYWGASLQALCDIADEKGYFFIGSNSAGNNAFFVRKDLSGDFIPLSAKEGFVEGKFRESTDATGKLTYLSKCAKLKEIEDMEIYDTRRKKMIKISEINIPNS